MDTTPINPFVAAAAEPAAAPSNVIELATLGKADKAKSKDRWSDAVMDRGHSIVPTILLWGQAKLDLTPDELNVLLQLISHWWYAGNDPHPSKETIAARMNKHPRIRARFLPPTRARARSRGPCRGAGRYRQPCAHRVEPRLGLMSPP
jgi:hypothetical protein